VKLLLHVAVMAAAMVGLSRVLPGFHVAGWVPAVLAAAVLVAVNTLVRPVLFVLTLPFTIVTFGVFLIVLNAIMLGITAWIAPGFDLAGPIPTLFGSVVLAAVGMVWTMVASGFERDEER
jgi:putative membrane protein